MLVLTRKAGERIQVGDDICVTVVRIADGTVRIGIEAPREFGVLREELAGGNSANMQPVVHVKQATTREG